LSNHELPFADKQDFEFAHHSFIARPRSLIIKDARGKVVWDVGSCFWQRGAKTPSMKFRKEDIMKGQKEKTEFVSRRGMLKGSTLLLMGGDRGWHE
jgi:hypothetical protein